MQQARHPAWLAAYATFFCLAASAALATTSLTFRRPPPPDAFIDTSQFTRLQDSACPPRPLAVRSCDSRVDNNLGSLQRLFRKAAQTGDRALSDRMSNALCGRAE